MGNLNLTVDEIHAIREENYQKTKNMTEDELIEYTKKESAAIKERLRVLQAQNRRKIG